MNNKGQTLVLFVFLIPIILLIFLFIIDYGIVSYNKSRAITNIKDAITYALKHKDSNTLENDIKQLLNKNIDNINKLDIKIDDNIEITVYIDENYFLNLNKTIKLSYIGTIIDNEIKIEKK